MPRISYLLPKNAFKNGGLDLGNTTWVAILEAADEIYKCVLRQSLKGFTLTCLKPPTPPPGYEAASFPTGKLTGQG